jgi:protein-arginine kinase activator protein McsA
MKCPKCGISVMDKPFQRMNAKGEIGIFWCVDCAKKHEPELFKNNIEDEGDVEKTLKGIFYPDQYPQHSVNSEEETR